MVAQPIRFCRFAFVWAAFTISMAVVDCKLAATAPLKSGEFTIELNGMKLWYKVSGAGPVCMMPTPAWGPSSDLYFRTMHSMEKLFTMVYLDSRGTGRSGRAKTTQEYAWDNLVADLGALRVHLKQTKVWLMGHSEGGVYILHYACKYPKNVRGLVLLSSMAVADAKWEADVAERVVRRKGQPWYNDAEQALKLNPKTDEELAVMLRRTLPFYWSDPKKAEAFKDDFAATAFSAAALEGQQKSERYPFDLTAKLQKVNAPALIVVGEDDFICSPESATRMHLALPNSKYLLIEKAGHFPWMEQPTEFETRVSEFLTAMKYQSN